MKIFRIYLVVTGVVCASLLVSSAPSLDRLLGGRDGEERSGRTLDGLLGGGGDGGVLGGLANKGNLFGGLGAGEDREGRGLLGGLLGGGGGDGGGLLGGLPDKSNLFGGILGGNGRSDDDDDPFQAVGLGRVSQLDSAWKYN